jgi:hypothetical protein
VLNRTDIDNLVQYVNLVTTKAEFRLNSNEALHLSQLIIGLKDLKDKLEQVVGAQQPQPPQGAENGMVRRRS